MTAGAAPELRDRYVGCLVGAGLADSMGKLTEFLDRDLIVFQYGPRGLTEPPAHALYTDDTQLAMATARGLLKAGDQVLPRVVEAVAQEYLAWLALQDNPVHRRSPGVAVMDALGRVRRGVPTTASADGGANDSIAATRGVPVALRYRGDVQRVVETAAELCRITHAHPAAVSAAAAAALFVDYALSGVPIADWTGKAILNVKRWCPDDTHVTVEAIRTVERTLDWSPEDAMTEQFRARPGYGGGWTADEALGIGLWCFLQAPDDYARAVRLAVNAYGDSDTDAIAFLTGAFSGAHNGLAGIPPEWVGRLEDGDKIRALAERLVEA